MNDEIKELFRLLYTDNLSIGGKRKLEKFINNLQQENKYLDELRNANYLSWQDSLSRIEKAVAYIKEHNIIVVNKEYIPDGISTAYDYELMNILNGKE